jgi:hypothetical protein
MRVGQSPRLVGLALTAGRWLGITLYDSAGSYVFLREQTPEQQAFFLRVLAEIGRMHELAAAHGRRLYAVVIPNKLQVENGDDLSGRIYDAAAPSSRILAWCGERAIPCLDLLPGLVAAAAQGSEPLYYPIDRHFTPRGYVLAADLLLDFLVAQRALEAAAPAEPLARRGGTTVGRPAEAR